MVVSYLQVGRDDANGVRGRLVFGDDQGADGEVDGVAGGDALAAAGEGVGVEHVPSAGRVEDREVGDGRASGRRTEVDDGRVGDRVGAGRRGDGAEGPGDPACRADGRGDL